LTSLLNTDRYIHSLLNRSIPDYDSARGPAVYRDRAWTKPTKPLVRLSRTDLDALPEVYAVNAPMSFRAAGINATIDPKDLVHDVNGQAYLERTDLLVLQMIADSAPERSVYISRSAGTYGAPLGLRPYMLVQGLAQKAATVPVQPGRDTTLVRGIGFVDVPRTKTLWESFRA